MSATCRGCESSELKPILSLGSTPLANALLTKEQLAAPEARFPLDLVFCEKCTLVQITEQVPPETMFGEYLYFSSFSDTMLKHAEAITSRLVDELKLGPKSLAAEVASNDGYLLQYYAKRGIPVLGIEPARNVAKVAEEKGIRTIVRFFGRELARELCEKGERADVIHANNVLAHVPDLNGVVAGFATLVKDEGTIIVECPYVRDFVEHCEFDTIYHEHHCYFSLTALAKLATRHGLEVHDVERMPIHGGSIRIFFSKAGTHARNERVDAMLAAEAKDVATLAFYEDFATRVNELKVGLLAQLAELKKKGARIAAYGAAAKGATLLNFFGIDKDTIDFVVDRNTHKQGLFMPGAHIPILAPEALVQKQPDYCLLLTWNFADEILAQQKAYRDAGGKFIIPIPNLRTV